MCKVFKDTYAAASDGTSLFRTHRLGADVSQFFPTVLASIEASVRSGSRNIAHPALAGMALEEPELEAFE